MNNDFEFKEEAPATPKVRGRKTEKVPVEEPVSEAAAEDTVNVIDSKLPEYTDAELEQVFDELMFNNGYSEDVKIGKRMVVTLKTRSGKDAREVMMRLDKAGYSLGLTMESVRSLYNLAQSVVMVNGRDISGESFEKKVELIEGMPTAVISSMIYALVKFDLKIEAAIKHGEENF